MRNGRIWLALASGGSFAIALLHIAIIFAGPRGYMYFATPDLADLDSEGSLVPDAVTAVLAVVFGVFGFYALAAAGQVGRPPMLRSGLLGIGALYTIRGLALGPELYALHGGAETIPARHAVFSAASLFVGACYLAGTLCEWRRLGAGLDSAEGADPPALAGG